MRIETIDASPFAVPLKEPFAISRASVTTTRAVLVRAELSEGGKREHGYGEAALPLGSSERPEELIAAIPRALCGSEVADADSIGAAIDRHMAGSAVARSGLHCALVDAWARLRGEPLWRALGGSTAEPLVTDITLPIADPSHLAELALEYWGRGFRCFKIKVGADLARDRQMLDALAAATPSASLRFDANEGFTADKALALLASARDAQLAVECFEQPCARDDLAGLRRVREHGGVPVVADESVRDEGDLERLDGAVDGINLKLVKMGGIDRCIALGRAARARGLKLMVGAMIESRLGLTAMAHAVAVLGGADWIDLDTAFLLATDPCTGGMRADGATLSLPAESGLGITMMLGQDHSR